MNAKSKPQSLGVTRLGFLALALQALFVQPGHAQTLSTKFSGFGTFGLVHTNSDDAELTRSPIQYRGASDNWDYGVDSRLGLQGTAMYEKFSVTGQLLTQRVAHTDIRPKVEWLFANYAAMDWLDVRVGRMVLPLFLLSDARNVGFASTWLRAPQEVYSLYPVTGVDGIQAVARLPLGDSILTVQPSYGRTSGSYSLSTLDTTIDLKLRKLMSVLVNWEWGDWTLHLGRSQTELGTHVNSVKGVIPFGPPLDVVIPHDGSTDEYMINYGLAYDNGKAIAQMEYVKRTQDPGGYENEGYYVMGGWRFGKFTPYYIYGRYEPNDPVAGTAGLKDGNSNTIGLRYEWSQSVAIKVQFERRDPINLFFNNLPPSSSLPPGFPPQNYELEAKKINALSIAVDVVF